MIEGTGDRADHRKRMGVESRSGPIKRVRRNRMIVELRSAGLTFAEIAEQITAQGYPLSGNAAEKVVRKEMEKLADENREDVSKLRALDLYRIDQALKVLWPKVREGNLKAMREYRAFIDQRSRLLGTYAAQKHEVQGQVDHILDPSAREEIERLERAFLAASSFDPPDEDPVIDADIVELDP